MGNAKRPPRISLANDFVLPLAFFPGVDDSDGEGCEIFGVSRGEGASFGHGDSRYLGISHIHRQALPAAFGGNFPRCQRCWLIKG